jgi:hypothetical protein
MNNEIMSFLKHFGKDCYWYGEETGDYDMNFVEREDFFKEYYNELIECIVSILKRLEDE